MSGEGPTVVEPAGPGARRKAPASKDRSRPETTLFGTTPLEALHAEEVMRTRRFLAVILTFVLTCGPMVPWIGGDPALQRLLLATLAVTAVILVASLVYFRDPGRYTPYRALVPVLTCVVAATAACLYAGIFSAALALFPFGIYFVSLGSSARATGIAYAACALLTGGIMMLQTAGVVPDRGVITAAHLSAAQRGVLIVVLQALLAATFWFGRLSRRATVKAVTRLDQALRQVHQRDAQLQEMNRDLERALFGGRRGRFSGAQLGRWRLGPLVGRGAMGEVYRAEGEEGAAAVKVLQQSAEEDPARLRRFLREAEIMSQLRDPHVVQIFEVGQDPDVPPWIAMELLEGRDLAWHLRKQQRLSGRAVIELASQVAQALERAREAEIVHRDLKPQNLFCVEVGGKEKLWKVLDFGVSKIGGVTGSLTADHVIGTPGYLAPEQARGGALDHRADVFSLAAITYRAITGRPPFGGEDYPQILFSTVYEQPVRPGDLTSLPEDVELVLALGLGKEPGERPESAAAFAEALERAFESRLDGRLRDRARRLLDERGWGR